MQKSLEQNTRKHSLRLAFLQGIVCFSVLSSVAVKAEPAITSNVLSIEAAVELAQKNDPWLVKNKHTQNAVESMSVAVGTLPDPKMTVALANLPTDTFDFDQEPMTQFKVGVTQMFPRGDTLELKQQQLEISGTQFPFQRGDRRAKLAVMVSGLWLEAYRAQESIALIEKDRPLFEQLADVAEASYASALGRTRQQDIIRAQLEITRLDDRLTKLRQKQEMAVEQLSQWLSESFRDRYLDTTGPAALVSWSSLELKRNIPDVPMLNKDLYTSRLEANPQTLYEYFSNHPAVSALDKKIEVSDAGVELARQSYKPEWAINASYAYRDDAQNGSDRADFVSVGVTFDLPFFTEKRQDKQVESAMSRSLSVKTEKWMLIRKMIADFEKSRTQLKRLNERQKLYANELLPQMNEQAEASLTAYTNDDGDFAEVVRARIAVLNAQINALNIDVDMQKTIIQLNYYFMKNAEEIIAGNRDAGELK
ncbi:TolC family protein [Desulfopila sp. IMCC35008]|uniref:TolC family protein n=1 Tax=Desulfopila sp. IMCC35008 TaxID=2653858 RepID=UPI0013D41AAA|nr:TolC family protein [Desulfopila sp. IMCC35008]